MDYHSLTLLSCGFCCNALLLPLRGGMGWCYYVFPLLILPGLGLMNKNTRSIINCFVVNKHRQNHLDGAVWLYLRGKGNGRMLSLHTPPHYYHIGLIFDCSLRHLPKR